MIFIGLDLSLTGTGVTILRDRKPPEMHLIKSKPPGEKSPKTEIERIIEIKKEIIEKIEENGKPDLVAIEGLAYMVKNATALTQLSGLNYMVREYLFKNDIPFVIVAPTSLKKFITGNGVAKKDLMLMEVYKKFGVEIKDDNIADAFSLAKLAEAVAKRPKELFKYEEEVVNLVGEQYGE